MLSKKVEIRPLYKKHGGTEKSNYRPISVLSCVLKIYERCQYDQIYFYFQKIFSCYQCSSREGISTHHIFLTMIEKNEKFA